MKLHCILFDIVCDIVLYILIGGTKSRFLRSLKRAPVSGWQLYRCKSVTRLRHRSRRVAILCTRATPFKTHTHTFTANPRRICLQVLLASAIERLVIRYNNDVYAWWTRCMIIIIVSSRPTRRVISDQNNTVRNIIVHGTLSSARQRYRISNEKPCFHTLISRNPSTRFSVNATCHCDRCTENKTEKGRAKV